MQSINYQVIKDAATLEQVLALLAAETHIGIDTETTGLDAFTSQVRLIQMANRSQAFIVDLFKTPALIEPIKEFLTTSKVGKVFHNAKFDLKMLKQNFGIELNDHVYDTMLASRVLGGGKEGDSHSLAACVKRQLGIELDKTEQISNWRDELSEQQLRYAAFDALITLKLFEKLWPQLEAAELQAVAQLEFDVVPPLVAMELAGILLDAKKWSQLSDKMGVALEEVKSKLLQALEPGSLQMSLFGEADINLDSPAQVLSALQKLGIPVLNTNSNHLQPFAAEFPVIEMLLEYRSLQKAHSSYGQNILKFINPVTGRIHAEFRQIGTPTGRFSCQEPNLQQIPSSADYRSCFIAPPGRVLIIADYSQIELRILADWANDQVLMEAFEMGADLHISTAAQMFGMAPQEVKSEHRAAAKQLNYGIIYGMGAQGLANRIHSTLHDAERLIDKYFATYRGVAQWLRKAAEMAVKTGAVRTRLGRLMLIEFDKDNPASLSGAQRLGKNMPIQGTSADITKRAMMLLHRTLAGTTTRLINNVHDELVFEVDVTNAQAIAAIVEEQMVLAGREFIHNVPVKIDVKISDSWLK